MNMLRTTVMLVMSITLLLAGSASPVAADDPIDDLTNCSGALVRVAFSSELEVTVPPKQNQGILTDPFDNVYGLFVLEDVGMSTSAAIRTVYEEVGFEPVDPGTGGGGGSGSLVWYLMTGTIAEGSYSKCEGVVRDVTHIVLEVIQQAERDLERIGADLVAGATPGTGG